MDTLVAVCIGVSLAAATGFRVFVPLLVLSVAARMDGSPVHLAPEWAWVASPWATVAFGVATTLEVGAYFVPWIDHALDVIASPAAVVSGTLVTAAAMSEFHPLLQWTTALVGGGGAAGAVQGGTVLLRALSGVSTGGLGNPLVAAWEAASSALLSILAFVIPLLLGLLVAAVTVWLLFRWARRRAAAPAPDRLSGSGN